MTSDRAPEQLRPRYGRIAAFAGAVLTTTLTLTAGLGLLPGGGSPAQAASDRGAIALAAEGQEPEPARQPDPVVKSSEPGPSELVDSVAGVAAETASALPADSGEGRRIVLDLSGQRVWLVDDEEEVLRSYLVSGSVSDNLRPGSFEVYSRSRHATGIDGSSMGFMVRFTRGDNAAIGFHDIPVMDGEPMQTRDQLGTPLSHGCVRQAREDAKALWRFAPVGTPVVVTA